MYISFTSTHLLQHSDKLGQIDQQKQKERLHPNMTLFENLNTDEI
ncbi:hypothetical protein [Solibacillus silvestris]|nr:hypothetical protein [Solibacillus silvestris]